MNTHTQKNNSLLLLIFGVVFFFVASFVHAQGFIEPSDQAPKNNVVDFISKSAQSQARYGKLRVGSDIIPNQSTDPIVDVIGNIYIQGNTYFDRQASPAWQAIVSQVPHHVNAGTFVTNGKLTIQSTAGPALYANSTLDNAIYVKTFAENTKAVFGQTMQVSGGSVSSGVRGDATDAAGAGIFAQQQNCPGTDISVCGTAAQFIGNVVVTGVIKGDGRGIVRTWTMNDANSQSKGISVKTFDVTDGDYDAGTPRTKTIDEALPLEATFVSMSVMVNASPYDPTRATVNSLESSYLRVTYDTTTRTLIIQKGSTSEDIVILMYYHQEISATIVDQNGNVLDPARALAGSTSPLTFRGAIGGGEFEGGEFLWTLHTDQSATDVNKCAGTACGTVAESGSSTTYIPPADIPASTQANTVWLKATWTADPAIYSVQQIDLYKITWTQTPTTASQPGYVLIGDQNFTFQATVSCPETECAVNPITWSQQSSIGSERIELVSATTGDGLYTSPTTIDSGSSWTSVVRAAIASHSELYVETSFPLLPQISITASVDGTPISTGGTASIGISKTVLLNATANGIPSSLAHDFNWTLQELPSVVGESLTDGSAEGQTNNSQPNITYTAPNSVTTGGRIVTATWRSAGSGTLAYQPIRIYEGNANSVTFAQAENTTGNERFVVSGFASERRIYSFCTTLYCTNEQVVNYDALPYTVGGGLTGNCGTLRLTGPTTSNDLCDPDAQICMLTSTFNFSATGTGLCTLRAKLMGDQRQTAVITLDPVGAGCTCDPKTGYCCVNNGGSF